MLNEIRRMAGIGFVAVMCLVGASQASDLSAPQGDVILTVTGQIEVTNADGAALFDLDALQSLGESEFTTTTIWTEGANTFTGVPLASLLNALEVESGTLKATAINDYSIIFPISEVLGEEALIAYAMNGKEMSVREKGPLWIVYPFDSDTRYQSEAYYSRSIWQLDRLEIIPE